MKNKNRKKTKDTKKYYAFVIESEEVTNYQKEHPYLSRYEARHKLYEIERKEEVKK